MYGRMLILMILNLYISRIALEYLGADKYGLMSLVTSIVVIGAFFSTVLEGTAQRYISAALAKKDKKSVIKTIQSLMYIYILALLLSVVFVEVLGALYINNYLEQELLTIEELNLIFQISILVFFLSTMGSILLSILIAFEKIAVYSIVTLLEVAIKLVLLKVVSSSESSIAKYLLVFVVAIIVSRLIAYFYVVKQNRGISFKPLKDDDLIKNIAYFVRWNLIGGGASILTIQGLNVVLNIYQNLTVNAARAFSTQLNIAITQMVNSIQLAFNPKIVKLYVQGENNILNETFRLNAKLAAYLSSLIIIVISYNSEYFLDAWLGSYPDILISFISLMLIELYFASFTGPLLSIIQASERIKSYQLVVGGTMILNVPISYLFLSKFDNPLIIYYVSISINIICLLQRITFVAKLRVVDIKSYLFDVIVRVSFFLILVLAIYQKEFNGIIILDIFSKILFVVFMSYFIVLSKIERTAIFKNIKIFFSEK
ncbi:hypothetical protein [Vibrio vulnificus]|uniref:hypothetical protein n=1 Tax=Vibrio vulnificus TaxID=672 RepID=UPI0019D41B01|nr:hypothetical protein [Vibrio vulnificus]